jgi:uncharacterized protein
MTPQERQMIDDLFDRLAKLESAPRDPNAVAAIAQGLRTAPNAVYGLVQTVLVQNEALRRADSRIQELEGAAAPEPNQSGGFLDSMRETIFGQSQSHGSVPNVPPPQASRPVWNSGQVLQQTQPQEHYNEPPYGQSYGAPQSPVGGGGGSFLGTAAASAAGVIGGSLLLNSIRSMMGGSHQSFADASAIGGNRTADQSPWSDQSGSNLARDAGVNDINSSSQDRADDASRAGLFDQASNDDSSDDGTSDDDRDQDDMDMDSDDSGGDGDSDYA